MARRSSGFNRKSLNRQSAPACPICGFATGIDLPDAGRVNANIGSLLVTTVRLGAVRRGGRGECLLGGLVVINELFFVGTDRHCACGGGGEDLSRWLFVFENERKDNMISRLFAVNENENESAKRVATMLEVPTFC